MNRLTGSILTVLLFPSIILAWGFHDAMGGGSPVVFASPKQSAMGGAWALPSSQAAGIFLNPAELSMLDGTCIKASGAVVQWRTSIFLEYEWDFFDSGLVGGFTAAAATPVSDRVAVGAGISRVADFNCNGTCNIVEVLGPNVMEVETVQLLDAYGSLWEANAGLSVEMTDWLIAGFSGGLRFGDGAYTLIRDHRDPQVPDDTTGNSWEQSDFCGHVGIIMPLEFGTFAVSGTNSTDRYRSRVAFGFQRDFSILNGSTMGIELDFQSIDEDPAMSGRMFAYLAEMFPGVRSTYSVGFIRASEYHRTALCLGTGANVEMGDVDLELGISCMSRSRAGYQFSEPHVYNIDDDVTYFSAGFTWML